VPTAPAAPSAPVKSPAAPAPWRPLLRVIVRVSLALAVIVMVIVGIVRLGGMAGQQLAQEPRYQIPFGTIETSPPPGINTRDFLTEVRLQNNLPESISLVDTSTPEVLRQAFARHPWTQSVLEVEVRPEGQLRVLCKYRVPVLAVLVQGEADARVVDAQGVLLPSTAPVTGLTQFLNPVAAPTAPPGQVWRDRQDWIAKAADLARAYQSRSIEKTDKGWRLVQPDGQVLIIGG